MFWTICRDCPDAMHPHAAFNLFLVTIKVPFFWKKTHLSFCDIAYMEDGTRLKINDVNSLIYLSVYI